MANAILDEKSKPSAPIPRMQTLVDLILALYHLEQDIECGKSFIEVETPFIECQELLQSLDDPSGSPIIFLVHQVSQIPLGEE